VNLVRLTRCYYSLGIWVQTHANATPIINERAVTAVTGGKINVQTLDRVSYLHYARSMYCCYEYEYGSDEYEYEYEYRCDKYEYEYEYFVYEYEYKYEY